MVQVVLNISFCIFVKQTCFGGHLLKAVIGNLLVTPYKGFTEFRTQQLRKQRKHQEQEAEKF